LIVDFDYTLLKEQKMGDFEKKQIGYMTLSVMHGVSFIVCTTIT